MLITIGLNQVRKETFITTAKTVQDQISMKKSPVTRLKEFYLIYKRSHRTKANFLPYRQRNKTGKKQSTLSYWMHK